MLDLVTCAEKTFRLSLCPFANIYRHCMLSGTGHFSAHENLPHPYFPTSGDGPSRTLCATCSTATGHRLKSHSFSLTQLHLKTNSWKGADKNQNAKLKALAISQTHCFNLTRCQSYENGLHGTVYRPPPGAPAAPKQPSRTKCTCFRVQRCCDTTSSRAAPAMAAAALGAPPPPQ